MTWDERAASTKSSTVMVKSFHHIYVMCFCDAFFIFVRYILVMKQCMFVNVKLWRVKASLLQLSLSIHVSICLLLLVKCAIHDPNKNGQIQTKIRTGIWYHSQIDKQVI